MRNIARIALLLVSLAALVGCDTGIRQMGPTEYGIRFRNLPTLLGGGIGDEVIMPGQTSILWPWDSLYRMDTSVRYVTWGQKNTESGRHYDDYVYTRAFDGNEVALAVTVQYRVSTDKEKLVWMLQRVATSNEEVEDIIVGVSRAYIRTFMNELKTSAFFVRDSRYEAIEKVKTKLQEKLTPYGIEIQSVILNEHRFERLLPDGTVDKSYQTKIDETQKLREDTERERLRIETVRAKKSQELNDTQATVNRLIAEAEGFRNQAHLRGDGYFQAKENDAKAILAKGNAEILSLKKQIEALSGPGGKAILKMQIAKELMKSNPQFVVVGDSKGQSGIDVKRIDTNELLKQAGIFESLREPAKEKGAAAEPPTITLNNERNNQ